ncbi:hypothetical protein TK45_15660 [Bowmanella sp. JS7-9]|nr:hypothetical protein TK45_15660 [Bowmanella sp. JS7-9]
MLPEPADLARLTQLLAGFAPYDGNFNVMDGTLHVVRASGVQAEQTHSHSEPSLCIVPQGAKSVALAQGGFEYDHKKMVVYAAQVPIRARVTRASPTEPFYCLVIPLNAKRLNELVLKVFPNGAPMGSKSRAVYVGDASAQIVKSACRLIELIAAQDNPDLLVPHTIDEILFRLLRSSAGAAIAQIGIRDSHMEKVSKSLHWLRQHYDQPFKVEELAQFAGMSVSSFHNHFKDITSMTPLQYQKVLRLQEARRLLQGRIMDITRVAYSVGYTSASQFSREYTREFGVAPSKDVVSH